MFAVPPRRFRSILAPVSGTSAPLRATFSKWCPAKRRRGAVLESRNAGGRQSTNQSHIQTRTPAARQSHEALLHPVLPIFADDRCPAGAGGHPHHSAHTVSTNDATSFEQYQRRPLLHRPPIHARRPARRGCELQKSSILPRSWERVMRHSRISVHTNVTLFLRRAILSKNRREAT